MNGASMLVGVATRVITPPLGSELAGFDARKGAATGVHDDLFVRALVMAAGEEVVALVSLDVIGVAQELTDAVRRAVHASTGIPHRNVILCATHTHCGPVTINHFFNAGQPLDKDYLALLERRIVESIEEAFAEKQPGVLRSGLVKVEGVAVNRRTENGLPIDDDAGVILIEDLTGRRRAIFVSYACHPTVLGPNTLDVTRDFPHYLDRALMREMGDDVTVLYFNGTEGDLSIGHKSFLSAVGVVAAFRTYEKAEQIGERLAKAVLANLPALTEEPAAISCEHAIAPLPLKSYLPHAEMLRKTAEARESLRLAEEGRGTGADVPQVVLEKRQDYLFARIAEYYALLRDGEPSARDLRVEVSVVRVGSSAIIFVPGEVFVEIGLAIRARSPFAKTMCVGLANDYIGYVPTVAQAAAGGYEVVASRVTPEACHVLEDISVKALQAAFDATQDTQLRAG